MRSTCSKSLGGSTDICCIGNTGQEEDLEIEGHVIAELRKLASGTHSLGSAEEGSGGCNICRIDFRRLRNRINIRLWMPDPRNRFRC